MAKPSIWEVLFDKEEIDAFVEKSKRIYSREISGSVTQGLKRVLSGRIFRTARAISNLLSHISTRVYGTELLCFGLLGTLVSLLGFGADQSIANPIIGILAALISIPLLLADKPLPILLQEFKPTDFIFFELFCIKRHTVMESERRFPMSVAVIIGFVPALLSVAVPLWQIAIIILTLICIYIGIESPEFVFFLSLFALPYIRYIPSGDIVLLLAIAFAVFSFAIKVFHGRRVLYIERYDILLGVMLIFVLISGIFVKGIESFSGSVRLIVLALGYILAGNIITNRRLAELSANAIVISGSIASVISVVQLFISLIEVNFEVTPDSLSSILARADGVAVLLMISVVFATGMIFQSSDIRRGLYVLSAAICLIALVISGEMFAITSLILGIVAYGVLKFNRLPGLFIPILLLASVAILLLPLDVLDFIFNYSPSIVSAEELFKLWQASLDAFSRNLLVGIGIGKESFMAEMEALGIFGHGDSSNLFIELGLEAGMFALITLVLLLITRLNHRSLQYQYVRSTEIRRISNLSEVCLFVLIAFGMVNYIWSDSSAYYLFWCIFGMGSASLRVAKRDYDDRKVYYEEASAFDSSMIDIDIG